LNYENNSRIKTGPINFLTCCLSLKSQAKVEVRDASKSGVVEYWSTGVME
jgi:hypothetical protein